MTARHHALALLLFAPLAACGTPAPAPDGDTGGTTSNVAAPDETGGVQRETVAPVEPAAPPPIAQAAIQTQPGPNGGQVTLDKVAVTGDVLTVQLGYVGMESSSSPKVEEVSLIDDATAQQIGVLKDNAGKWLAAPLDSGGRALWIKGDKKPVIVWFKFPAPPPTSRTVSLNIPEVAPFDGVPVTR